MTQHRRLNSYAYSRMASLFEYYTNLKSCLQGYVFLKK